MQIEKNKLIKAMEPVRPGLASKEMIEQSTSFCFKDGNIITFNDDISVSFPIPELKELTGAINANEFYNFVKKINVDEIALEITENEIQLKAGRSRVGLKLQTEVVLPLGEIGKIKKWTKLPDNFAVAINFCMNAASRNMTEAKLTCVHINEDIVEASDRFRIAHYKMSDKVQIDKFLIPANTCAKLVKIFPSEIAAGEGWVHFKDDNKAVISCRIFDEEFPNTAPHMKTKGKELTFPKQTLQLLERAGIFAKRDYSLDESVSISVKDGKMQVKAESEAGWYKEVVKIEYKGDDIEFKITPSLLKGIITETNTGIIDSNKIVFSGENWKYLTMLRN